MSPSRTAASMPEEEPSARFSASSSPDMASAVLRAAFSRVLTTAPSDNVPVLESPSHDFAYYGETSIKGCVIYARFGVASNQLDCSTSLG